MKFKMDIEKFKQDIKKAKQKAVGSHLGFTEASMSQKMKRPDRFRFDELCQACAFMGTDPNDYIIRT